MTQQYEFEKFDRATRPAPEVSTVTFQKRGTVGVSEGAFKDLGEPQAVTLYFDSKRRVMGIRAAKPEEPGAIPLRKQAASNSYLFTGVAFATRYGIPLGRALRYRAEPYGEDNDNMIVVDLNQEAEDVTVTRNKPDDQHGSVESQ